MFEKRRMQLVDLLRNRKEEIDLSRQHQIYGAVKEIELFLESIKYFEEISGEDELENVVLPPTPERKGFLKKMRESMKDRFLE